VLLVTCWFGLPEFVRIGDVPFGHGWLVNPDYRGIAAVFSVAYMLGHIAVLCSALVIANAARRAWGGVLFSPMLALVGAVALMYVAELAFFETLEAGTFRNAQPEEGLYVLVMLLVPISLYRFATVELPAGAAVVAPVAGTAADQLATSIVAAHSRLLGGVAIDLARRVDGVAVRSGDGGVQITSEDAGAAIDRLVHAFEQVSGTFGLEVSRLAAAHVLREHPDVAVPHALRV
jgi:hypothetical protein